MPKVNPIGSQIIKKYRKSIRSLRKREEEIAREMRKAINKSRQKIMTQLSNLDPDSFKSHHLQGILSELDNLVEESRGEMLDISRRMTRKAFDIGREVGSASLALTPDVPPVLITEELFVAMEQMSLELVSSLTDDLKKQVAGQIRRSVLGRESPADAMRKISKVFGTKGNGINYKAERIVRTEVNRTFEIANNEVGRKAAEDIHQAKKYSPDKRLSPMMKVWIDAEDERVRFSHRDVSPVPYKHPNGSIGLFNVGGEKLEFPKDPRGSAANTINCRCTVAYIQKNLMDEFRKA